jgi:hypothetical protein
MTRCPSSEELRQWLADGLTGPEAEALEAHVETCAGCQQAVEDLLDDTGGRTVGEPAGREDVGSDFLRRLERDPPTCAGPLLLPNVRAAAVSCCPHQGRGVSTPGSAERPRTILISGIGSQPAADELRPLLRRRLLFVTLVFLGGVALGVPFSWFGDKPALGWRATLLLGSFLPLLAALAWILWRKPGLSLVALRWIELLCFGGMIVLSAALCCLGILQGSLAWYAQLGAAGMSPAACYQSVSWCSLIVLYGIFIPTTWRRCAVVVGTMTVTPLVIYGAAGLADKAVAKDLLLLLLAELGAWLAIAAAMALFGSHRLEVLRQEASAARRLGHYQLKERLGAGGMGEVYLAEHVLLRRPCAIKLIRPERAGDPRNLARFEREVQATATLTHPNTVEVYDYGHADDGTFYYVMEYLPGLSLEELVKQHGPLPPARAVHLLRQVCGALQEAHAAGLIHRDIKPGNIIVGRRGGLCDVAKLLDFGLVQAHGLNPDGQQLTQEGVIAGTPAYMSPEQAAARGDLDGRSDLYSLGAVAYFLLTGQPPFSRDTAVQTLAAHLSEPVVPPDQHRPDLPADLQAVLLRCLEKGPGRRFPEAASLEQALGQCGCAAGWTREQAAAWWRAVAAEPQRETQPPAECVS